MLDVECSVRGLPATYVQKVKVQHRDNRKLFEPKHCDLTRTFGILHYAGSVVYDSSQFLETNRDVISDDIISVFGREHCQFGFVSHLFGNELKSLTNGPNGETLPRGASFSISPNIQDSETDFDRAHVTNQVRSLQVLETVNLMAKGFPHRMRFKAFNGRYRMLARPMTILKRSDEKSVQDCELILDCYSQLAKEYFPDVEPVPNNKDWAHGRKHIFLSEGARQQLEYLRIHIRTKSATKIQSVFRGYLSRKRFSINNVFKPATANNNMIRQSVSLVPSVLAPPTSQSANSSTVQQQQPPIPPQTGNNQNQTGNNQNNQNLNLMMMQQQQQFNTSRSQNRPKPISCTPP